MRTRSRVLPVSTCGTELFLKICKEKRNKWGLGNTGSEKFPDSQLSHSHQLSSSLTFLHMLLSKLPSHRACRLVKDVGKHHLPSGECEFRCRFGECRRNKAVARRRPDRSSPACGAWTYIFDILPVPLSSGRN